MAESTSKTTKLELRTAYGPVFRDVLSTPPRDCTAEEIPVLDLTPLHEGSLTERKALAAELHKTAGMCIRMMKAVMPKAWSYLILQSRSKTDK